MYNLGIRREVFIGVLILGTTLVGSRGTIVNREDSPAKAVQPPQSLLIPPTLNQLRAVIFEMVDLAIPENFQSKYYPSANRFD